MAITPEDQARAEPPANWPPPLQALWWLKKGGLVVGPEWRKAHSICQTQEGDHDYDADVANAGYWYRRAGETRAGSIQAEWERIAAALTCG